MTPQSPFPTKYLELGFDIVFYIALVALLIHALVLLYHWFSYGTNRAINIAGLITYVLGGSFMLLVMFLSSTAI